MKVPTSIPPPRKHEDKKEDKASIKSLLNDTADLLKLLTETYKNETTFFRWGKTFKKEEIGSNIVYRPVLETDRKYKRIGVFSDYNYYLRQHSHAAHSRATPHYLRNDFLQYCMFFDDVLDDIAEDRKKNNNLDKKYVASTDKDVIGRIGQLDFLLDVYKETLEQRLWYKTGKHPCFCETGMGRIESFLGDGSFALPTTNPYGMHEGPDGSYHSLIGGSTGLVLVPKYNILESFFSIMSGLKTKWEERLDMVKYLSVEKELDL